MNSVMLRFDPKQVEYLVHKTGCPDPQEAVETFVAMYHEIESDPNQSKIYLYLKKLMEKDAK